MTPPPASGTAQRTSFNVARVAAIGALVLAVIVIAWLLLSGDGTTKYKILFQNAGQLVNGDQVQIGGHPVGSIKDIRLTDRNLAEVDIELDDDYAPLHEGTTAVIRATSLSGIANRYIALTPGPNSARELAEGATLDLTRTTTIVDLDQLFNVFTPNTRRALQRVIQGSAQQYDGKGEELNEASKYFAPALSTTDTLISELLRDQDAFTDFLVDSSRLVSAISERRDDLADLVGNANATAAAINQENVALNESLQLLPGTLRKANTTFVNLRATLDDLDVLVDESKPVAPRLAPFFRRLRPLVTESRPVIADLRQLITAPGPDNDLINLLNKTPRLQRIASPTFQRGITTLRRSLPVIEFIRPYAPEFIGWLRDFGQNSAAYDANGHYARIQPIFNAFQNAGGQLVPIPGSQRFAGAQTDVIRRCPGTASQPPADGSAPWVDTSPDGNPDCDPALVPPGP